MKKVYLTKESKIFGVCGGIGEAYDVDPTTVRIATVFLCVVTGGIPLLVTYIAAWFLMPKQSAK